jgi:transposase-like protein
MAKKKSKRSGPGNPTRRPYPVELRLRAVRAVVDENTPTVHVGRMLGIAPTALAGWVQAYRDKGLLVAW